MDEKGYWQKTLGRRLSRREWLRLGYQAGMGLAGATLLGCAAPSPAPVATTAAKPTPTAVVPRAGGTLRAAYSYLGTKLDPADNKDGGFGWSWVRHLYDNLLEWDSKGNMILRLATSWEAPDLSTYIFKLRRGVKFHDGTDFSAQAAKAHFERAAGLVTGFSSRYKQYVKSMDVVDDYTLKFNLKYPYGQFIDQLIITQEGAITSPTAAAKYGDDFPRYSVGTGPFRLKSHAIDDRLEVTRFPEYWEKDKIYLDGITWKLVPDRSVKIVMLKSGQTDFVEEVEPARLPEVQGDPNIKVVQGLSFNQRILRFNMKDKILSKLAVRQAITYAVDRQKISDALFKGLFPVNYGYVSSQHGGAYDPSLKGTEFDLAKAKQKMVEAGYPDGFEMEMTLRTGRPDEAQLGEVLQDMLSKIGIRVRLHPLETAAASAYSRDGKHQLYIAGGGTITFDPRMAVRWMLPAEEMGSKLCDPPRGSEIEGLLAKAAATANPEQINQYVRQIDKLAREQVYCWLPLVWEAGIYAISKNVMGFVPHPDFGPRLMNIWLAA
ncbi:MAG: ABC transporter substrate-binding protein [Chloroflexi bacterium]|nr:ABC transporter substrate-binding protein [Chloroflexota bacterium]